MGTLLVVVFETPPHIANMKVLICTSTTSVLIFSQSLIIASFITDMSLCQKRRPHAWMWTHDFLSVKITWLCFNFMSSSQWISTLNQYEQQIKEWGKFNFRIKHFNAIKILLDTKSFIFKTFIFLKLPKRTKITIFSEISSLQYSWSQKNPLKRNWVFPRKAMNNYNSQKKAHIHISHLLYTYEH